MAGEAEDVQDSHGAEGVLVAGRYRLVERLGAGGMGRVWKAHDESLDCDVAVKEVWLPPALSDAERADRLARAQREARNAARMRNHPHIVSVHDMVTDKDMPWIVMDLVPSQNLVQAVEQHGALPREQVVKIGLGLLDALTASHAAGILHRDVKPANVLLTTDGRVLLTDFGIAVQESDNKMTANGVLVGSPEFVAPERARGEAGDGASDLFSLGATLYFAAEARSPFSRATAVGVLTAILFEDAAPITRQPALAPLISGLLAKDPAMRWDAPRARAELERLSAATQSSGTGIGTIPGAPIAPITPTSPAAPIVPGTAGSGTPFPGIVSATSSSSAPRKNAGRNVGIGVGSLLVVGGVVAAIALSGGGKKDQTAGSSAGDTASHSASAPDADQGSSPVNGPNSAATQSSASGASGSDAQSTATSVDTATWDSSSTDQTTFTPDSLLPVNFTDTKGVVYTATNRWTDKCVTTFESARLKAMLTQYKCDQQAIGTYVDSTGRILVDVAVLPLPDAQTAKTAFSDMQGKKAFTLEDWGIWCPKTGPGADICGAKKNTDAAQQYGYIQPDHRYLVHAVSLYVNLSADKSAQDWLVPAATGAAKQGGPQVAVQ